MRKMKKPSSGLDDALESLHSEPSGWGELPSPKPTDVDNGTEIWGVPDDMQGKPKSSNGGSSHFIRELHMFYDTSNKMKTTHIHVHSFKCRYM